MPASDPPTTLQVLRERVRAMPEQLRAARYLRVWLLYLPGPGPLLMSWLRKRWVLFRNPHARIEFRGPVYLGPGFSIDAPRGGTFIVGPGVEFRRDFRAELGGPDAVISIGAMSVFTYGVLMQCTSSIEIGEHSIFGQATMLVDGNHRFRDTEALLLDQGYELRPLKISDHVMVATKCTVIADIGERTFVGAGAVVTKPLPAFCVAAGVPARVIDTIRGGPEPPPGVTDGD